MIIELFIENGKIKGSAKFDNIVSLFMNFYSHKIYYRQNKILINFNDSFLESIFHRVVNRDIESHIHTEHIVIINLNNMYTENEAVEYIHKYLNENVLSLDICETEVTVSIHYSE